MESQTPLQQNLENRDAVVKYLNWIFWLVIFSFIGFIAMIVVLINLLNSKSFMPMFTLSGLCFSMSWVFASAMLWLTYSNLDSFNDAKTIRLIKILGWIPLANISMVYFIQHLKRSLKKEEKKIENNA
ncbi:MAG: hypothetical protein LBV48_02000 [Mycoplasmataceae bacterium]|jgi:glucan phosphoethanolaminetransferase (alkaline phosphatase superfamily)|nr:hypothetical protein [Mycoplasmataceae bacterium]